jgi:hypothetical protein
MYFTVTSFDFLDKTDKHLQGRGVDTFYGTRIQVHGTILFQYTVELLI